MLFKVIINQVQLILEQSDNLNNSQITGNTLDQTQSLTNNESNELENETNTLATNTNSTIDENAIHVDNTTQHHLEAKTNDKSSKDAKNTSNPITHDTKVVREESNLPKKEAEEIYQLEIATTQTRLRQLMILI